MEALNMSIEQTKPAEGHQKRNQLPKQKGQRAGEQSYLPEMGK